ncbi:type I restriction endonuclease subunit R [Streptomyces sp. SS8]
MGQPEYEYVERPLIEQLKAMGWQHLRGAPPGSPESGRDGYADAVLAGRFREAVRRINLTDDGRPWLTPEQLDRVLAIVLGTAPGHTGRDGVAGNLAVTELLRKGIESRFLPGWRRDEGLPEHVRLVDWNGETEGGNDFLAVSQLRIDRRGGSGPEYGVPDLVLFVNGLPWVVIECKAPGPLALDLAVEQVIGYAGASASTAVPELVRFAQLLVATDREGAEVGTVTAGPEHFAPWRTVEPATEAQVRTEVGKPETAGEDKRPLTAQEVLVAGALRPAHLLDLVRDFTAQAGHGTRTVKLVARYQQFRAVQKLARGLARRKATVDAGREAGHRAGVVWHTQGSGKSLTMAFLVRRLRSDPVLRGHKVVVVTDRIDLEKQITGSLTGASGDDVHRASSVREARRYLAVDVPDLTLVTIQKARRDEDADDGEEEKLAETPEESRVHNRVANPGHDIVVLVDEAHRSHRSWQHARLRAMLPNAAVVGFTGTPIVSGAVKKSEEIFGTFADIYTLRDAERDGAVVPVRYEAHHVPLEVVEKALLDADFDGEVPSDPEQRERVLRRFARRKEVLEAPSVIEAKAEHIMWHWARTALPDRLGAQVVAVSRLAAVRYRRALLIARDRLLERLAAIDSDVAHDPMAHERADAEQRALLDLLPHRHVLAEIDAAVVISETAKTRDPEEWGRWTSKSRHQEYIRNFTQGIAAAVGTAPDPSWEADTHGAPEPGPDGDSGTATGEAWHQEGQKEGPADGGERQAPEEDSEALGPLAFLVVKAMLLTGFDAPVEQVLYLDRAVSGVELLQAIARTNRPYPDKQWGQVVDYVGIGRELGRALGEYDREHLRRVYGYEEAPSAEHLREDYEGEQPTAEQQPWRKTDAAADDLLRELSAGVRELLDERGIGSLDDERQREDLLAALEDPLLRARFDERVRDFLAALNAVLPRPQALAYEDLARRLGEVQYLARRRYLDGHDRFSPRRYGAKVRQLISRHLRVTGIEERIPPVEITDPVFLERVRANRDPRARVSYLRSSLELHITARLRSDPVVYGRFSERLEQIVRSMNEDFEQAASAMADLVDEVVRAGEAEGEDDGTGLDPWAEQPVHRLLKQALEEGGQAPAPPGADLVAATRNLTVEIAGMVRPPQFATLPLAQDKVRRRLRRLLEEHMAMDWDATGTLAGKLLDVARERREDFLRYGRRHEQGDG